MFEVFIMTYFMTMTLFSLGLVFIVGVIFLWWLFTQEGRD